MRSWHTAHPSSTNLAMLAKCPTRLLLCLDQVCDPQSGPSLQLLMCMALLLLVPARLHHTRCWHCLMPASKHQRLPSNRDILVASLMPNAQPTPNLHTA